MQGFDAVSIHSIADEFPALAGWLETVCAVIELIAIVILVNGLVRFLAAYVAAQFGGRDPAAAAHRLNAGRLDLSRYILAALEVIIVSDIIRTAISPALYELALLGILVLIRSAISFFLEREMRDIERDEAPR